MKRLRECLIGLLLPAALAGAASPEYVAVIFNTDLPGIEAAGLGVDFTALGYESVPRTVPGIRKDLNSDGTPDLILRGNPDYCGTGGCNLHVLDGKSRSRIGAIFGNPLVIHATAINGWPVLSVYSHGSATSGSYGTYVFDGKQYVQASSVMLYDESVIELFSKLRPEAKPAGSGTR